MRPDKDGERLAKAAARLIDRRSGPLEVAVVLGSGLSQAFEKRAGFAAIPYDKLPGSPQAHLIGHPGLALVGEWSGKRVAVFAGRVHLYQGFSPNEVTYFVRLAAAAGAHTLVITNAAGGLNPDFCAGDLMLITDQINLTGAGPLIERDGDPFVNMSDAYSARLRALARHTDPTVREGVFAGVRGPAFETIAEIRMLSMLGADAVAMSTVLEAIAARALGLEVLGLSLIANGVSAIDQVSHHDVLEVAARGSTRILSLLTELLPSM